MTAFEWFLFALLAIASGMCAALRSHITTLRIVVESLRRQNTQLRGVLAEVEALADEAVTRASDPMVRAVEAEVAADVRREFDDIIAASYADDREGPS